MNFVWISYVRLELVGPFNCIHQLAPHFQIALPVSVTWCSDHSYQVCGLWPNCRNCCFLQEIGVKEHYGDVKFQTRSRNIAVSQMCNENYAI